MIMTWPLIAQETLFFKAINTTWPKKTEVTQNYLIANNECFDCFQVIMDTNKSQMFQTKLNVAALFMRPVAFLFVSMTQNG